MEVSKFSVYPNVTLSCQLPVNYFGPNRELKYVTFQYLISQNCNLWSSVLCSVEL